MREKSRSTASRLLLILLPALVLLSIGPAAASAAEVAAVTAAASAPPGPLPILQPDPIFLATYLCIHEVDDPCTGEPVGSCSKICNVGQSCGCFVEYGQSTGDCGAYVKSIRGAYCFG